MQWTNNLRTMPGRVRDASFLLAAHGLKSSTSHSSSLLLVLGSSSDSDGRASPLKLDEEEVMKAANERAREKFRRRRCSENNPSFDKTLALKGALAVREKEKKPVTVTTSSNPSSPRGMRREKGSSGDSEAKEKRKERRALIEAASSSGGETSSTATTSPTTKSASPPSNGLAPLKDSDGSQSDLTTEEPPSPRSAREKERSNERDKDGSRDKDKERTLKRSNSKKQNKSKSNSSLHDSDGGAAVKTRPHRRKSMNIPISHKDMKDSSSHDSVLTPKGLDGSSSRPSSSSRRELFANTKSNAHGFAHGLISSTPRTSQSNLSCPTSPSTSSDFLRSSSGSLGNDNERSPHSTGSNAPTSGVASSSGKSPSKSEDRRQMYAESRAAAMQQVLERDTETSSSSKETPTQYELKLKRTSVTMSSSPTNSPYHFSPKGGDQSASPIPRQLSRPIGLSSSAPPNSYFQPPHSASSESISPSTSATNNSSAGKSLTSRVSSSSLASLPKFQKRHSLRDVTKLHDLSAGLMDIILSQEPSLFHEYIAETDDFEINGTSLQSLILFALSTMPQFDETLQVILTHTQWIPSTTLLATLSTLFNNTSMEQFRPRIVRMLIEWLRVMPSDFHEQSIRADVLQFYQTIARSDEKAIWLPDVTHWIDEVVRKSSQGNESSPIKDADGKLENTTHASSSLSLSLSSIPKSEKEKEKNAETKPVSKANSVKATFLSPRAPAREFKSILECTVLDFSSSVLAEQMTLFDHHLLAQVSVKELLCKRFNQKETSPGLNEITVRFNLLTRWIATEVCTAINPKLALKVLTKFISIIDEAYELRNYNAFMAIYIALSQNSVSKLGDVWLSLSSTLLSKWNAVCKTGSPLANFKRLRVKHDSPALPAILTPILFVKDLVMLDEGNSDFMDGDKQLINFQKFKMLGAMVLRFYRAQQACYPMTKDERVQQYLANINGLSEVELLEIVKKSSS